MKKFENIVIVTDLDGTFLNSKEGLVERNLEAVEYFKANGGHFTVATGRASEHARGAVPCISELINMPAVTCNGACVYDFRTDEMPFVKPIEHEDILRLFKYFRENFPSAGIRASTPGYCFVSTPQDMEHKLMMLEFKRYINHKTLIAPVEEWKDLSILKMVVRIDKEILPEALAAFKEHFGDEFSAMCSWETIIDIQSKGINKGTTIRKYVRDTMGEGVKIYACGDYINDTEMLKEVDVAVCPSNAHPKIKEISDLCMCSNDDGLIADLVEYIEKNLD